MKQLILLLEALTTWAVISCLSNNSYQKDHHKMGHDNMPMQDQNKMPLQDNIMEGKEVKMVYDGIKDDLKEHFGHISQKNDIEQKWFHFSMMSCNLTDLVKAFDAGMTLYHDHCPIYNKIKGTMWLSETNDIRNT